MKEKGCGSRGWFLDERSKSPKMICLKEKKKGVIKMATFHFKKEKEGERKKVLREKMKDIGISVVISVATILFVILLLVLISSHIYTFLTPPYQIAEQYEVFKDLLAIILAIIGVAVGVMGYGIYRYVSERVEGKAMEKVGRAAGDSMDWSCAFALCETGYTFWRLYKRTNKDFYLKEAIVLTEMAYKHASSLDERDPKYEKMMCDIMNNIGYYYAERARIEKGRIEDREFARDCARYIRDKILKYPDQRAIWQETYDFIFEQYP